MNELQASAEKIAADYERLVKLKQTQIDALLDISQAINNNLSIASLLRIYEFTLRAQFSVPRMMVFLKNEVWECVCAYGVGPEARNIDVPKDLIWIDKLTRVSSSKHPVLADFEVVIPVQHQDRPLAYVLIGDLDKRFSSDEQLRFIQTLTNIVLVAVENRKLLRAQIEQEVLKKELELAAQMQAMLFPEQLPDNDMCEMAAFYYPHHDIGGDYYDYLELPDGHHMFCVGDISGKGIAAALLMANFQANLRSLIKTHRNLTTFAETLNDLVSQITRGEKFITLLLGVFNPATRQLNYINAGHNPSLLYQEGKLIELTKGCTILGMFPDLPFVRTEEIILSREALLINYTDGLIDFENEAGEFYGVERLKEFVIRNHHLSATEFNRTLINEIKTFKGTGGSFLDDVTLLTCRYH
ncbi:MAG: hypothetical protein KatS3mg031_1380 [Chitinophagales bacterium]|nr:MAG: hypothetical protein KatS3mg031_1380 [Chitinophagales bacterium]